MNLSIVSANPNTKAGQINFAFDLVKKGLSTLKHFQKEVKRIRESDLQDGDLSPSIEISECQRHFTIKTCAYTTPRIVHKNKFNMHLRDLLSMGFITFKEVDEKFPNFPANSISAFLQSMINRN